MVDIIHIIPSLVGGTSIVCSLSLKVKDCILKAGARIEGPPAKIGVLVLEDDSGQETNYHDRLSSSRATEFPLFYNLEIIFHTVPFTHQPSTNFPLPICSREKPPVSRVYPSQSCHTSHDLLSTTEYAISNSKIITPAPEPDRSCIASSEPCALAAKSLIKAHMHACMHLKHTLPHRAARLARGSPIPQSFSQERIPYIRPYPSILLSW